MEANITAYELSEEEKERFDKRGMGKWGQVFHYLI